jgi:hypothetical protein
LGVNARTAACCDRSRGRNVRAAKSPSCTSSVTKPCPGVRFDNLFAQPVATAPAARLSFVAATGLRDPFGPYASHHGELVRKRCSRPCDGERDAGGFARRSSRHLQKPLRDWRPAPREYRPAGLAERGRRPNSSASVGRPVCFEAFVCDASARAQGRYSNHPVAIRPSPD